MSFEQPKSPLDQAFAARKKKPQFAPMDKIMKSRMQLKVPPDYHPETIRATGPSGTLAKAALKIVHNNWSKISATAKDQTVDHDRLAKAAEVVMTPPCASSSKLPTGKKSRLR
jgi:hypothetical protein